MGRNHISENSGAGEGLYGSEAERKIVMAEKVTAQVLIGGRIYTLSGYESEEHLQKIANYVNGKLTEMKESESFRKQSYDLQATLIQLSIADDYFKAKQQLDILESENESKDKEIYDLKHEVISTQIKAETTEKTETQLQEQVTELKEKLASLEAELEEYKELIDS